MHKKKIQYLLYILFINVLTIVFSFGQEAKGPNIVWIVTEDNSKHYLRLYNHDGAPMPNIEALAERGVVFNYAFSNAPVCSVARSTIISGCYAPRIGAQYHRRMKLANMPEGLHMFPHYLREAGYYTTNNSKEDYNLIKSNGVWDESSRNATYRNRSEGQPFFHVQNFGVTHEGQLHFSDSAMRATATTTSVHDMTPFPYHPNTEILRYTNAWSRDRHLLADELIGKFIAQIEEDGHLDDTFIFYYGDHGGVLPRSKGYIYETGVHVPMVVYIPEKWKHLVAYERGTRSDAFVQFIDLGPTALNLAGIEIPGQMDGKPFLGNGVRKRDLLERNYTFSYADRFDEKYDLVRAVRIGKYKYIRNYQPFNIDALYNFYRYKMMAYREWAQLYDRDELNASQKQFFEPRAPEALYNVEDDPYELQNLASDLDHFALLKELRVSLDRQLKSMPDLSFIPEPYLVQNGLSNPVEFGMKHKEQIADLMEIADLQLVPFDKAKKHLRKAIKSSNSWERYWALIVCSTFGREALSFSKKIRKISLSPVENNLVRARALEFLALTDQENDSGKWLEILRKSSNKTEANLILNSVALLKMVKPEFEIKIPENSFEKEWVANANDLVRRRLNYINDN